MSIEGAKTRREITAGGKTYSYYGIAAAVELGLAGVTRKTLGLDGSEVLDINGIASGLSPRAIVKLKIRGKDGKEASLDLLVRLDTRREVEYYRNGGQLHYVLRDRLTKEAA